MIRIADINDRERLAELFEQLHRRHVEIKTGKWGLLPVQL